MENLKRIFGLLNDGKRIYRIYEENEVQRDEFAYCQLMHEIVFGKDGYAETLGPTWEMIHDPRFAVIENQFIIDRHAIFGGDARLGKQYINDDGTFSSSVTDLEQYAEILGEGRNFHNVLKHPNPHCKQRQWMERIYRGYTLIKPHLSLKCGCNEGRVMPETFVSAPDEIVWNLIRQECPNRAFTKGDTPTAYGEMMFRLIRADLIGLIADYAETPLIDSYVYLKDNGVVVAPEDVQDVDPHGLDHQRVLQEIDILENALTHRATLRLTATKVLRSLGVEKMLSDMQASGGKVELTDSERDELLRIVYESRWPDEKLELTMKLAGFIAAVNRQPLAERQAKQLKQASNRAHRTIEALLTGQVKPINHYTEPVQEIPENIEESEVMRYGTVLDALTKNPLKGELFQVYVAAEEEGELGVLDILAPIFDPHYELTEETYKNLLRAVTRRARSLRAMDAEEVIPRGTADTGVFASKKEIQEFEGEFHGKDSLKVDASK